MNPHRTAAAFVALASLLTAGAARAQYVGTDMATRPHVAPESPQHFALEARFGAFTPAVDTEPSLNGKTPYADIFGTSPQLLAGAELDWEALRIPHFGTFGPGLGGGYMRTSANAKFTEPHNGQTVSGEQTSLEIIPFYGVAVLRIDTFWRDYGVPLVPWVKLGVGVAFWRASNTLGTSSFNSTSGEGHSIGTHFALGLGLNLNAFDESAAKEFDNTMGVNGTYLFAEWTREDLAGLGFQNDPMRVGGNEWTFGLALEF